MYGCVARIGKRDTVSVKTKDGLCKTICEVSPNNIQCKKAVAEESKVEVLLE